VIEKILGFSIRHRWFVLLATVGVVVLGLSNYARLPIDAVPDITNVQVQINTLAPGLSALEVEQHITFPIETALGGLPRLDYTRSISFYGLSQITVVFQDGTDMYFARQLIAERLQEARDQIPPGAAPQMGPISTGLGEIYMWTVDAQPGAKKPDGSPYTSTDLRELQDWIIKPQLRNIPGVAEVNTTGGFEKQYQITPRSEKLIAFGLSFRDLIEALEKNNANVGAGYIERNGEQYLIRSPGQVRNLDDVRNIVVAARDGVPIRIRDVAAVGVGHELRDGAATHNGEETVLGTTFMLLGENSRAVSHTVDKRMEDVNRSLPPGIVARTVYDRTNLVDATIETVKKNLFEGAILVVAVLFALLGNVRAALIVAAVIPLSMLFTITGMVQHRVSANLISLGALDFGIIVDGAVIIVENCVRKLAGEQQKLGRLLTNQERLAVVFDASREVRTATMFGELIIMIVYLPILTLSGVEGKMFVPMALTVLFALFGAMILSVTFVPAAVAIFLRGKLFEEENLIVRGAKWVYIPLLGAALRHRALVVAGAIVLVTLSLFVASRMGAEFIPSLDEGDLALGILRVPGTSLTQSVEMQKALEKRLLQFPEVKEVFTRLGTSEIASDPQPPSIGDGYVMLKPRSAWPDPNLPKSEFEGRISAALKEFPGTNYEISQPIEMRVNELISGVHSDVGIKIFGDNLDALLDSANKVAAVMRRVPGAVEVVVEHVTGRPYLTIEIKRDVLARYGLSVYDVQSVIEAAIGGKKSGAIFEGDRPFPLVVRLPEDVRADLDALRRVPVPLPHGQEARSEYLPAAYKQPAFIPLGEVADFKSALGPNEIGRENGKRRIVVTCNIRQRDIGSFIGDAKRAVRDNVKLPPGYWIAWGGQFEQLESATRRLEIVVPAALLLILILLFMTFGSLRDALLVYSAVPLALTGGILALWIRAIPFSISAGVGFIALSGVAVLNGIVLVTFINSLRREGKQIDEAIRQGSLIRLRPILMTALVASLGFLPMALAHGRGAEVQRPLATVVIGGILSCTILTLIVLPAIYRMFHRHSETNLENPYPLPTLRTE
jgi:cobalt-zinc-cadmium resistance protein CzcA